MLIYLLITEEVKLYCLAEIQSSFAHATGANLARNPASEGHISPTGFSSAVLKENFYL